MPAPTVSELKVYSLGIVAANKDLNSTIISVTPIEDTPMADGQLTDNTTAETATGVDAKGATYKTEVATASVVDAEWLPIGSDNRLTAPDVRRGEQVVLYRFSNTDKFYWVSQKTDMKLRKLETVIYGFSGSQTENEEGSEDNTYIIEVSTHKQYFRLHTSTANGEPYGYDLKLDTGNGNLTFQDDIGNILTIDSTQNQFRFENADGQYFDLTKKVFSMLAEDQIKLETNDLEIIAHNTTNIQTDDFTMKSSQNTFQTDTQTLTATENTINASTIHNGSFALNGDMTTDPGQGGSGGTGKITIAGDMQLQGNSVVEGTLVAEQVTSKQDIIAPNV